MNRCSKVPSRRGTVRGAGRGSNDGCSIADSPSPQEYALIVDLPDRSASQPRWPGVARLSAPSAGAAAGVIGWRGSRGSTRQAPPASVLLSQMRRRAGVTARAEVGARSWQTRAYRRVRWHGRARRCDSLPFPARIAGVNVAPVVLSAAIPGRRWRIVVPGITRWGVRSDEA
jgi:hypothetical protein